MHTEDDAEGIMQVAGTCNYIQVNEASIIISVCHTPRIPCAKVHISEKANCTKHLLCLPKTAVYCLAQYATGDTKEWTTGIIITFCTVHMDVHS